MTILSIFTICALSLIGPVCLAFIAFCCAVAGVDLRVDRSIARATATASAAGPAPEAIASPSSTPSEGSVA